MNNTFIGPYAGYSLITAKNVVCIGENAGADLVEAEGVVIIGDNIRDLNHAQENILFIGNNIAIGKILFGKPCNLREIIEEAIADYKKGK